METVTNTRSAASGSRKWVVVTLLALTLGLGVTLWVTSADEIAGDTSASAEPSAWELMRSTALNEVERYSTLRDMVRSADGAIWGRVVSIDPMESVGSESEGFAHYARAHIEVLRSLWGKVTPMDDGYVALDLFLPEEAMYAELAADAPGDEAIFFLRDKAQEAAELGLSADEQAAHANAYRLVSSQGFFLDKAGKVAVPMFGDEGFPRNLEGQIFEQIRKQVEAGG